MVFLTEDTFGAVDDPVTGESVLIKRFTLQNSSEMKVQVITFGATITSIIVPDGSGFPVDVVLGYDRVKDYQSKDNPYIGATIGRVCNRIAGGKFKLKDKEVEVTCNHGKHHLHGGAVGFDKVVWELRRKGKDDFTLTHESPDGHDGFPGVLRAYVSFKLTEDNCLYVCMEAHTKSETPTVINMTNHTYFNLAGHASGRMGLRQHMIMINADKILATDEDSIPTGQFVKVEGTPYDFRQPANLGERLDQLSEEKKGGFDDNYCVKLEKGNKLSPVARVQHPCGRWLEIATNMPGLQFYTSNYFPDPDAAQKETPLDGKNFGYYKKHCAFCLETQKYPDAVHHKNFPSIVLEPRRLYSHHIQYRFGANDIACCSMPMQLTRCDDFRCNFLNDHLS